MNTVPPSPQDSVRPSASNPAASPPTAEEPAPVTDASNATGASAQSGALEHAASLPLEQDITMREVEEGGVGTSSVTGDFNKDEEKEMEHARQRQRESSIWPNDLPPSPPLTRPSTGKSESLRHATSSVHHGGNDIATAEVDDFDQEELGHEFSTTLGSGHAVETDTVESHMEDLPSPKKAPKPLTRQPSAIQLNAKMEPQPWDLVDPPETNGQTNGEYYASLTGRKFNTLNSSHARALIPKSSYYFGPPPSDSAYGTRPIGQIGVHHPREILRVERDYTGGELIQFAPIYPLELEGRITPTQFLESINAINELLISAHSLRYSFLDNMLSVFTLQLSRVLLASHYEKVNCRRVFEWLLLIRSQ
ncbi:Golgin a7 [Favolaschia claudopus]|uniref:Ras modification protein ERF4 n=1 Tax=Favolaschia claudopus TaxID=2862362 RepID=A0AAW0EJE2_9AGAR